MRTVGESYSEMRNTQRRTIFYGLIGLLIVAIFGRNVFNFPIPVILFLGITALIGFFGGRNEIIAMMICCISFCAAFQYKYALFLCVVIYIIKFPEDFKISAILLPLILMMIWEFLHALNYDFSIYEYFRGFAELIACSFLISLRFKDFDYTFICRVLAVSAISMMFIILLNLLAETGYDFQSIFTGGYRFGVGNAAAENFGVNYNPNVLGFICNLSIIGLIQIIISKKQFWLDYIILLFLTFFGFMTLSRAFLVCFVVTLGLTAFIGEAKLLQKVLRIVGIIAFLAIIALVVLIIMPTVFENFLNRFIGEDDISNGRIDIFLYYNSHIFSKFEYWFFGIGLQDVLAKMETIYGTVSSIPHHGLQEIVLVWGLPGFALFIWWLILLVKTAKRGKKYRFEQFLPLIFILLYVQFGQLITNGVRLLSFCFVYLSLCWNKEGQEDEEAFSKNN